MYKDRNNEPQEIVAVKNIASHSNTLCVPESRTYFNGKVASSIIPAPKYLHDRCEDHGLIGRLGDGRYVLGVFDGIGGHGGGEEASKIASDTVFEELNLGVDIASAFKNAEERIHENPNLMKMRSGTTACVAIIDAHGNCIIGNIGDSRAYLVRPFGQVSQLTVDQNNFGIEDKVEAKRISKKMQEEGGDWNKMTRDEIRIIDGGRNILGGSIGTGGDVDIYNINLMHGDRLVIMTDGIGDVVANGDIEDAVPEYDIGKTLTDAAEHLMEIAQGRPKATEYYTAHGEMVVGKQDDKLVIAFEF